jgi:hypothetical protein
MARSVDPTNRYRKAWQAGRDGRALPQGLADLADSDPKIDAAFDAGQGGTSWEEFNGPAPSPAERTPPAPSPSGPSVGLHVAGASVGSVLLGLLAAAIVLSVVDYGPKGPLIWFRSKFLNQPPGAKRAAVASYTTVAPAAGTSQTGVPATSPPVGVYA